MQRTANLRAALAAIPALFPASIGGLHARVALALESLSDQNSKIHIALAPFYADRRITKRVPDALVIANMPVPVHKQAANEIEWFNNYRRRSLAKDSKIEAGPFLLTITNFMQSFTAPSPFLIKNNLVLNESVSQPLSLQDIYEPCHLHVFVSSDISSLTQPLPSDMLPAVRVLDLPDISAVDANVASSALIVSTSANSPESADVTSLIARLENRERIITDLLHSISNACTSYVLSSRAYIDSSSSFPTPSSATDIIATRKEWSRAAHTEIRDVLERGLAEFERRAVWWKLSFVIDDLQQIGETAVLRNFLPAAEKSLIYVLGQLSSLRPRDDPTTDADELLQIPKLPTTATAIDLARIRIAQDLLPNMQAQAQKLVLRTFFDTQLPIAVLAFAGWQVEMLQISGYAASAFALLGLVWGFKRVQSYWDGLVSAFARDVRDAAVEAVERSEAEIHSAWEAKVGKMRSRINEQAAAAEQLEKLLQ
ncbi:hypothetical protein BZA70DRAFT_135072 [Myxozyma melibiosi]|uniref:Mmc1 C-terminal domain-containing protein n=1 Tax=Myxozyma melibiosi TaxID=54550 RepID=A0ABR1F991_9ASCO